jgi:hypothetical protein
MSQLHYSSHRTRYGSSARARGGRGGGGLLLWCWAVVEQEAMEEERKIEEARRKREAKEARRWKALTPEQQDAEKLWEKATQRLCARFAAVLYGAFCCAVASIWAHNPDPLVWRVRLALLAALLVGTPALSFLREALGGSHERKTPAHLR